MIKSKNYKECKEEGCTNRRYARSYCLFHDKIHNPEKHSLKKKVTRSKKGGNAKKKVKKPTLISLSTLDKFVWKITSLAFRVQDADINGMVECCTCGKRMYYYKSDAQLGHFMSRRWKHTKFKRENLHTQDTSCNKYRFGEQYRMGVFLDKLYGEGTAEKQVKLSKNYNKYTREDYKKDLLVNAKILLKESKEKNLWDWKNGMMKWELHFLNEFSNYNINTEIFLNKKRIG